MRFTKCKNCGHRLTRMSYYSKDSKNKVWFHQKSGLHVMMDCPCKNPQPKIEYD